MSEIAGMLVSALGQGFIYAPMALGVFLPAVHTAMKPY